MPLNILLVNRALPWHVAGGLEHHVLDLARGLAEGGVGVHLLTAPLPPAERDALAGFGIRAHPAPTHAPRRYSLEYLRRIGDAIRTLHAREHFDLIHAQEFALGFWRPGAGGPPLVLSVHGTITSETPLHRDCRPQLGASRWPWAAGRFGRRLAFVPFWKRHLAAARRILVDSEFTRRELERLAPDCVGNIHRVPLAVREPGPPPPTRAEARRALGWGDELRLVTIGRLEWQKGQTLALEALAGLRGTPWHYSLAGEGSARGEIERLAGRLRLAGRVTLTGRVDDATKRTMLAAADLFVWPERTHPAFGLAGLEAMLAGTRVVATPRGAIPEVLGPAAAPQAAGRRRGGWIAAAVTPEALRDAMAEALAEPRTSDAERLALRDWALRHFDYQEMIQNVIAQYQAVAGK